VLLFLVQIGHLRLSPDIFGCGGLVAAGGKLSSMSSILTRMGRSGVDQFIRFNSAADFEHVQVLRTLRLIGSYVFQMLGRFKLSS